MKKKAIMLVAVILVSAAGLAQGQEGQLSGSVGLTYVSEYIWRGFDYFPDDQSGYNANASIDLYGSGFGLDLFWARAIDAPLENSETMSVGLNYSGSVLEGETFVTTYKAGWVYYGYPDEPRQGRVTGQAADMQELFVALAWPELCPAGIVPSYTILTMWPSESKSVARNNQGWAHIIGIGYDFQTPGLLPETPEQTFHLSAAMVYNDGVMPGVAIGAASGTTDHDWSHGILGISTDFELGEGLTFTPGFYYQSSWEDTVNPEDEYWLSLGVVYSF